MSDETWRGKVGVLDQGELKAFLDEPKLARLACLDEEGWPYVNPCWQEWDGESFWVIAREKSKWGQYLKDDQRCGLSVDEEGSLRKVVAKCRAVLIEEPNVGGLWVDIANRMSLRYLGENGPLYMKPTLDKPRWLFRLDPIWMQTWQGVDWAARYK